MHDGRAVLFAVAKLLVPFSSGAQIRSVIIVIAQSISVILAG